MGDQTVISNRGAAVRRRKDRLETSNWAGTARVTGALGDTCLRKPIESLPAQRDDDALRRFLEHPQVGEIHEAFQ